MKDELCGKIVTEISVLRPKTYSCLTDENDEQTQKKCVIKRKLKFEGSKHCLKAPQLENKTNQQERNKLRVNILRQNHKEFIKNNKLILPSQSRFNPICDGPLLGFSGMLGKKAQHSHPRPQNLSHISYNDETWHSYNFPIENQKNI